MPATRPNFPPIAPRAEWKPSQKLNDMQRLQSLRFENQTLHLANRQLEITCQRVKRLAWAAAVLLVWTLCVLAMVLVRAIPLGLWR